MDLHDPKLQILYRVERERGQFLGSIQYSIYEPNVHVLQSLETRLSPFIQILMGEVGQLFALDGTLARCLG